MLATSFLWFVLPLVCKQDFVVIFAFGGLIVDDDDMRSLGNCSGILVAKRTLAHPMEKKTIQIVREREVPCYR